MDTDLIPATIGPQHSNWYSIPTDKYSSIPIGSRSVLHELTIISIATRSCHSYPYPAGSSHISVWVWSTSINSSILTGTSSALITWSYLHWCRICTPEIVLFPQVPDPCISLNHNSCILICSKSMLVNRSYLHRCRICTPEMVLFHLPS